jgi:hypothetical protein
MIKNIINAKIELRTGLISQILINELSDTTFITVPPPPLITPAISETHTAKTQLPVNFCRANALTALESIFML